MKATPLRTVLRGLLVFVSLLLAALSAQARRSGIQIEGCSDCHGAERASTVTLAADHEPVLPGETVTFTVTIAWPYIAAGGLYVPTPQAGELTALSGEGLRLSEGGLTHTSPKTAVDGQVTFAFSWKAPEQPGALLLHAYAVAANGDRRNADDAPGESLVNFAFGCEPKNFFYDVDGDGHGNPDPTVAAPIIGCADQPAPIGYSPLSDDCNDLFASIYSGAPERCNGKDDNCNGEVDEDSTPETLFPDPDGDGFYGPSVTESTVGCLPLAGYAAEPGDCAPSDATRYPGAEEICNLVDDDCNGFVDESVRPHCGVGRCERQSTSCDPGECIPGEPLTETCNLLDDDCNGELDDEEPCGPGRVCLGLICVADEEDGSVGAGGGGGTANGSGSPSAASGGATPIGGASGGVPSDTAAGGSEDANGRGDDETVPATDGSEGQPNRAVPTASALESGCDFARGEPSPGSVLSVAVLLLFALRRQALRRGSSPRPRAPA
jgi:hypothetical protein